MIVCVSNRCDVIAFYSEWFFNRLEEGYFHVRNPFNYHQVLQINIESIDMFLFITKDPRNLLTKKISIPSIYQITLTPYKYEVEKIENKLNIINSIIDLSNKVGSEFVYLRYDPIILTSFYTKEYHYKAFEKICMLLHKHINRIIISFVDECKNYNLHFDSVISGLDIHEMSKKLSSIASLYNLKLQCCAEKDLTEYGILSDSCLTNTITKKLINKEFPKWNSRKNTTCNCVKKTDIGFYNSCPHYCTYCYANYNEKEILKNYKNHDPKSSLLIGYLEKDDKITIKKE